MNNLNHNNNELISIGPEGMTINSGPIFYTDVKRRVFFYRNTFLLLGIVFLCLTEILTFHSPNWNFKLLFGHGAPIKLLFSLLSGSFSIISLWLGCSMRAAIEAIHENSRKAKRKLKKLYLASSLSPIDRQKYQLLKDEILHISRKSIVEYESIEKLSISEKQKQEFTIKLIEKQKETLIRCIQEFS